MVGERWLLLKGDSFTMVICFFIEKERKLAWNVGLHSDVYKPLFIPIWACIFSPVHSIVRHHVNDLDLAQSQKHEVTQTWVMVNFVREVCYCSSVVNMNHVSFWSSYCFFVQMVDTWMLWGLSHCVGVHRVLMCLCVLCQTVVMGPVLMWCVCVCLWYMCMQLLCSLWQLVTLKGCVGMGYSCVLHFVCFMFLSKVAWFLLNDFGWLHLQLSVFFVNKKYTFFSSSCKWERES